ncbi:MAG TPA: hypothetical protein VLB44_19930, partial [Kofleriaceae bacterium]|nr:hypothetical protein [Kofleriaceae bacterium]
MPGLSLALVLLWSTRAFAYDHLSPDLVIRQDVDVNVVLVGFSGLASPDEILANAAPYNGVPRVKNDHVTMGQRFDFRYHAVAAPPWFEDAFF